MQLAHKMGEARATKDCPIVEKRLLTQADLGVIFFELFRYLIDKVVLVDCSCDR